MREKCDVVSVVSLLAWASITFVVPFVLCSVWTCVSVHMYMTCIQQLLSTVVRTQHVGMNCIVCCLSEGVVACAV